MGKERERQGEEPRCPFGCQTSKVRPHDGKGQLEVWPAYPCKTSLLNDRPGFAVGAATVRGELPQWSDGALDAPRPSASWRGNMFDKHKTSGGLEYADGLAQGACRMSYRAKLPTDRAVGSSLFCH